VSACVGVFPERLVSRRRLLTKAKAVDFFTHLALGPPLISLCALRSVHSEMVPEPLVFFTGGWIRCLWQVDRLRIVVRQVVVFTCFLDQEKEGGLVSASAGEKGKGRFISPLTPSAHSVTGCVGRGSGRVGTQHG